MTTDTGAITSGRNDARPARASSRGALYRSLYPAVDFALMPQARREPAACVARHTTCRARTCCPRLHKIKRRFPRMVMPGGLIERHLGMPHYDVNYQTVNLMDLVRLWRRFPDDDFADVVQAAVKAVRDTSLLKHWTESKQKQALGYWLEALYHLYTLTSAPEYRQYLAEGILIAEDAGLRPATIAARRQPRSRSARSARALPFSNRPTHPGRQPEPQWRTGIPRRQLQWRND